MCDYWGIVVDGFFSICRVRSRKFVGIYLELEEFRSPLVVIRPDYIPVAICAESTALAPDLLIVYGR